MAIELPDFDPDVSRVSGFTEPGHEICARLFLPLARSGTHRYIPWHVAAEQAGRALHALTTWDDLAHAADVGLAWEPPSGTIDDVTAQALVGALAQQLPDGAATSTRFALWEGHAGEIGAPLHDVITPVPASGQNFLCDGSFQLLTARLDWVLTRTDQHHCHLPAAIWPADRSFVLASALYQDSFYLSCSRTTFIAVRAAGLDVLEIDPEAPLPSRGD